MKDLNLEIAKKTKTFHHLKTWPQYFEAIIAGIKSFEVRINDRNYEVGDCLQLEEYNPRKKEFTNRRAHFEITYVLHGSAANDSELGWKLPDNVVVMGIRKI